MISVDGASQVRHRVARNVRAFHGGIPRPMQCGKIDSSAVVLRKFLDRVFDLARKRLEGADDVVQDRVMLWHGHNRHRAYAARAIRA